MIVSLAKALLGKDKDYSKAKRLVKSMITNPAIISTNPPFAISLEVESYDKSGTAEVSQIPIIVAGATSKQVLNDNVAPQPKEWTLSGYIGGDDTIEQTNLFTPIVWINTQMLWLAFTNGSRVVFKDIDQTLHTNCVISSFSTSYRADCRNKTPFSMVLRELVKIEAETAELTETEKMSSADSATSDAGTTGGSKWTDPTTVVLHKKIDPSTIGTIYTK